MTTTAQNPAAGPGIALAAPHPAAVDAARELLERGGTAIDAVVAAAVALTVVYPHMCSVGGDVIAIVRSADGSTSCVNSSGAYGSAPAPDLAGRTAMPVYGPLTVTVPGAVAAWDLLLAAGGSRPREEVLAPSLRLARDGMAVSPGLAAALRHDREPLAVDPGMTGVFFRGGRPAAEGELVRQPALAATLEALARDGFDSFYRGPLAARLAAGLARLGVPVTAEDLAAHRATTVEPLSATIGGHTVRTAPPNSQGFTLLRTLGALAGAGPLDRVDAGVLAELFHSGDVLRDGILADPRFADVDLGPVLGPEALRAAYAEAAEAAASGSRQPSLATPRPGGDTIAITAVDGSGTAVSLIQSVFHAFGSRLLEPGTGLVLHNRGAFFSLDPASPNAVAPGKRPAHTLVPVTVEYADGTVSAHGTMGGKAQSQIHAQLLLRALEGRSPAETVSAPRFIVGSTEAGRSNDAVFVEPGQPAAVLDALAATGMDLTLAPALDSEAGHAMVATRRPDGSLDAGADPRSDGATLIAPGPASGASFGEAR